MLRPANLRAFRSGRMSIEPIEEISVVVVREEGGLFRYEQDYNRALLMLDSWPSGIAE